MPPGLWLAESIKPPSAPCRRHHRRHGRRGQDAAARHQHPAEAVGHRHTQDNLDGGAAVMASVAADHEGFLPEVARRVVAGSVDTACTKFSR